MKRISKLSEEEYEEFTDALVRDDVKAIRECLCIDVRTEGNRKVANDYNLAEYSTVAEVLKATMHNGNRYVYHKIEDNKWFTNAYAAGLTLKSWQDVPDKYDGIEIYTLNPVYQYKEFPPMTYEQLQQFSASSRKSIQTNSTVVALHLGELYNPIPEHQKHGSKNLEDLLYDRALSTYLIFNDTNQTWYFSYAHAGYKNGKRTLRENPNLHYYKIYQNTDGSRYVIEEKVE